MLRGGDTQTMSGGTAGVDEVLSTKDDKADSVGTTSGEHLDETSMDIVESVEVGSRGSTSTEKNEKKKRVKGPRKVWPAAKARVARGAHNDGHYQKNMGDRFYFASAHIEDLSYAAVLRRGVGAEGNPNGRHLFCGPTDVAERYCIAPSRPRRYCIQFNRKVQFISLLQHMDWLTQLEPLLMEVAYREVVDHTVRYSRRSVGDNDYLVFNSLAQKTELSSYDGIYVDLCGNLHNEYVLFDRHLGTIHRCTPEWTIDHNYDRLEELPDMTEQLEWQPTTPDGSRPPTPPSAPGDRPLTLESYEEKLSELNMMNDADVDCNRALAAVNTFNNTDNDGYYCSSLL